MESNSMNTVTCTKCHLSFTLRCEPFDVKGETVVVHSCLSGGVYSVVIICPNCHHTEEIMN